MYFPRWWILLFHPNTTIKTKNGYKQIQNLNIGDELDDDNFVESIMVLKPTKPLYLYSGIFVTGEHYVYENSDFIMVKDSEKSTLTDIKVDAYYCTKTTHKYLKINQTKFADWDDLNEEDKNKLKLRYNLFNDYDLNNKFNSGISSDVKLILQDGTQGI